MKGLLVTLLCCLTLTSCGVANETISSEVTALPTQTTQTEKETFSPKELISETPTEMPVVSPTPVNTVSPIKAAATAVPNYSSSQKTTSSNSSVSSQATQYTYIGNKNSHKFHRKSCSTLPEEQNRIYYSTREDAINAGMVPCKRCHP